MTLLSKFHDIANPTVFGHSPPEAHKESEPENARLDTHLFDADVIVEIHCVRSVFDPDEIQIRAVADSVAPLSRCAQMEVHGRVDVVGIIPIRHQPLTKPAHAVSVATATPQVRLRAVIRSPLSDQLKRAPNRQLSRHDRTQDLDQSSCSVGILTPG